VRGHLRRDRRCLDRLFEVLGTRGAALHWAAANDCTAVVAFLLAKGAAVDVVASGGPGAQSRRESPGAAAGGASPPAVLRSHSAALYSIQRPSGERQAAAGRKGLGGHQEQLRLGASADITTVLKTVFHRQSQ